jgi:hypothetical protein
MLKLLYVGVDIEIASMGYIGPLIDVDKTNEYNYKYKNYYWSDIPDLVLRYREVHINALKEGEKQHWQGLAKQISNHHENLKTIHKKDGILQKKKKPLTKPDLGSTLT